jgi:dethiobiotin synthetase
LSVSLCVFFSASPHYAAEIDNVTSIDLAIIAPETENHLIIEGAGGICSHK